MKVKRKKLPATCSVHGRVHVGCPVCAKRNRKLCKPVRPRTLTPFDPALFDQIFRDFLSMTDAAVNDQTEFVPCSAGRPSNILAFGTWLIARRAELGSYAFSEFIKMLPAKYGIASSTGYRYMRLAQALPRYFPNKAIRDELMRRGDGRGIVTIDNETRRVVLTPSFQAAMEVVPIPAGLE
ncbi:MAG: hypothetical protein LAO76_02440 [Acidobacteriia bacterium]|nr:hypothetical protein [Terriglobia bacterium]